jgi:hypothetical protein
MPEDSIESYWEAFRPELWPSPPVPTYEMYQVAQVYDGNFFDWDGTRIIGKWPSTSNRSIMHVRY